MRYFSPRFQIATLAGEQRQLMSKIGGIPWGLPSDHWPSCCGRPQKLLAQLCHEPPMLDLGFPGAVLHLFQCLECCGIDEYGRDAFVIDGAHLGNGLVRVPEYDRSPDLGNALIGEFWITGWEEHEDGIPAARLAEFFIEEDLWALQDEFPNIDWFDSRGRTKFGGSPRWTGNGPLEFPPPPFEFLFQLDNYLYLDGFPPSPNEAGGVVMEYEEGTSAEQVYARPDPGMSLINAPWIITHERSANHHYAGFTNLGSDGTAYVFIDRTRQPHGVKWYWNR